ncbi:MAG: sodium-dependent bicarbonate transport family permease [Planctomycetaceae bacterium]
MWDVLRVNLGSPLALAFVLGIVSRLLKSELSLPRDLYSSLSIYLLLALGLKGGVELSHTSLNSLFWPGVVTVGLGLITPVSAYLILRRLGRFPIADAAGIAAHYGSVSAVTFIAAQQFVQTMNQPAEGFMPTLLTLLEIPGIQLALGIGAVQMARERATLPDGQPAAEAQRPMSEVLHEVLTSRSMILMVGGLLIGCLMGERGYEPVKPFFEGMFKGALTLFLLEMGLAAGARLGDLKSVGLFLLGFGMIVPVLHGALGVFLGHWSGLSIGGATVLGTMSASASYIAAPPAVRMTLPEANPTYYLTAALAITFPFNIVLGIPLYYRMATLLAAH